jgi:hypothetical protein
MTLQEQFNSIKNGKGNKDQFLKQARQTFPQYLTKFLDFDTSVNILKSKQLINESIGGVVTKGFDITNWKQIFEAEVKAEEKTQSKEVNDANRNMYDDKNVKSADNINFSEILKGYLVELGDVKNAGKSGDELKDIVVKNLSKDPLHYTKDGMFGVKGVGYTTEAPGLGEPKAPKGKFKSSGYGDIEKEVKVKANVQDSLGDKEAETSMPKKVKEMSVTPQNSAGVKKMKMPGVEKTMKLQEVLDPNKFELGQEDTDDAPMCINDKAPSKPMKAKVDIKSTLEKIASEVFKESDLNKAKSIFKNYIETAGINDVDKKKILKNLESIKNIIKLYQYLGNSLLHYEGMGVSKLEEYSVYQGDVSKMKPEPTPKDGEVYLKNLKAGDKFSIGELEYIVIKPETDDSGVKVTYADGTGNMRLRGLAIVKLQENIKEQKFRSLIRQIIKEELNEISPELFKRATDISRERGQDQRTTSMGQTFFNKFKGKPLMNGTIIDVSYMKPQRGEYEDVAVTVEHELPNSDSTNSYIYYDVKGDEWAINKEITRADARILSLIAQHINPNTKYKETSKHFTIKGY